MGGIVGAISIVPLIAAYVFLSIAWKGLTQQPDDYQPLFLAPLLLIGNIVAGACIAASGAFSICKVDSLTSLSAALESLSMVGIHALALTIVTAIGVAIVIELAKRAKGYISGKITQPEEKLVESSNNHVKDETPKPDSKIGEAETKEKTARNEEVPPTCLTPLPPQHATHICTNVVI
ncbi:MAG: hypothetical protein KTV72_02405 [Wolbachia endosymbiont of Melophagus ovinus]|nr:hypothetical protein [Wolbachia endosymbiont of Melophagus ovinus]